MEVGYIREMRQNYLVITMEEAREQGYEARMMIGNSIEGLLKFRIKKTDGSSRFCYEITSRQPLARIAEAKFLNNIQIRSILLGIARTLTRMEDYLLTEEQILLTPDYIYLDPETYEPFLCLIPGKRGNFPEEFSRLLQFLLEKTDHQDQEAVVMIYGLYRESLKENYGLDDLLKWLFKESYPKMGSLDEEEKCETMDQEKIESWDTQKPDPPKEHKLPKASFSEKRSWYWYLMPAAMMFFLTAASVLGGGMRGFIRYGIWLALTAIVLSAVGIILSVRSGNHESSSSYQTYYEQTSNIRLSCNQTSCRDTSEERVNSIRSKYFQKPQQVQKMPQPLDTFAQPGQWQMVFEEEEPEQILTSPPPEDEGMNTVLLWGEENLKKPRVLAGEDGSSIPLSYYPFIIGKQEGLCDYVISKSTVSRLHLRIDETDSRCQITDLNSTNGTYVNGRCLDANETVEVEPGDEIGIADLKFRLK